jgi:hypothetical protein
LKLDLLATEYSRLGSALFWLPRRPPRATLAMVRALRDEMLTQLMLAGALATAPSLWPLARDPRLRALNTRRTARMVEAQARATRGLAERLPDMKVVSPHHGCFLCLHPRGGDMFRDADLLAERLRAAGIEAKVAPSFGYDFVALTPLIGNILRLAIADLPDDDVDRLVGVVGEFLSPTRA